MPLTDDDFVKTGKLEGYSEMIQKLHEEEQTQPEITYDLQLDDDEDEEENEEEEAAQEQGSIPMDWTSTQRQLHEEQMTY